MAKKKLTTNKKESIAEKNKARTSALINDEELTDITMSFAENSFLLYQMEKGNSKQTISFYERFFKKYYTFLKSAGFNEESSVGLLAVDGMMGLFKASMGNVSQQTVNSYLRGYRAFGNFCEERGLIKGFYCPIKEVEPPAKNVYTEAELKKLLVKPDIRDFSTFRNYTIISLILGTGARSNTILNIKIKDVDLDEGYIIFNTTKAHKTVRLGLPRKTKSALTEYMGYWRKVGDGDIEEDDYLFCNIYGEQLTRSGLCDAIESYNKHHGVSKTSIHLLRHTFAKNWIMSGGDIITLSMVLTHSELDMVKRYANLYRPDIKDKQEEFSVISQMRTHSGETIGTKKKNEDSKRE